MQIPFHLALLPTLIIASFPVAAADTQDETFAKFPKIP